MIFLLLVSVFITNPVLQDGPEVTESESHRIALSFSDHSDFIPAESQFSKAAELGIDLIEISDFRRFQNLADSSFYILYQHNLAFVTRNQLVANSELYTEELLSAYSGLKALYGDRIAAVSLFSYPDEVNSPFIDVASIFADSLASVISEPLYYRSAFINSNIPSGINFRSFLVNPDIEIPIPAFVHFAPSDDVRESLRKLEQILLDIGQHPQTVVVLPAHWFFEQIEKQPDLEIVFSSYLDGNPIPFPLPKNNRELPFPNWSVIFLFVIWGSFLIHFKYQTFYANSLTRYFINHSFFVDDIVEHRIRNAITGIILLVQHTFLTGLFFYIVTDILISDLGLKALSVHFPLLLVTDNELLSLFFIGIVIALLLETISILWIFILNNQMNFFSQVLNLYSWPLHINLLVVTLLVVLNQRGAEDFWMLITSFLFALTWFFSFNLAAIDGARFLKQYRILNLLATVGVHVVIVVFAIWYVLNTPEITEAVGLAFSLP